MLQKNEAFVDLIKRLQERLGLKAFEVLDYRRAGELDWLVIARPDDHRVSMDINTWIPRDHFYAVLASPGPPGSKSPPRIEGVEAEGIDELAEIIQKHFRPG